MPPLCQQGQPQHMQPPPWLALSSCTCLYACRRGYTRAPVCQTHPCIRAVCAHTRVQGWLSPYVWVCMARPPYSAPRVHRAASVSPAPRPRPVHQPGAAAPLSPRGVCTRGRAHGIPEGLVSPTPTGSRRESGSTAKIPQGGKECKNESFLLRIVVSGSSTRSSLVPSPLLLPFPHSAANVLESTRKSGARSSICAARSTSV